MTYRHTPVLLAEVLQHSRISSGSKVIDCTLGGAGHAGAALDAAGPQGLLLGIDKDAAALDAARERLARFSQQIILVRGDHTEIDRIASEAGIGPVDFILYDLGLSSAQIEDPSRGMSYRTSGPLDMRMDRSATLTAADVVNTYSQAQLTRVIRTYGEERWAARIAAFIVKAREATSLETTEDLVKVVKEAIPAAARRRGPHPARRVFQALRVEVNGELRGLDAAITDGVKWLRSGGRIAAISYHSLEDRIVKSTFKRLATGCICPPELAKCVCAGEPVVRIVTRKPVTPGADEVRENPSAESAKLRVAEKL